MQDTSEDTFSWTEAIGAEIGGPRDVMCSVPLVQIWTSVSVPEVTVARRDTCESARGILFILSIQLAPCSLFSSPILNLNTSYSALHYLLTASHPVTCFSLLQNTKSSDQFQQWQLLRSRHQ
jgi:hypothetical protein